MGSLNSTGPSGSAWADSREWWLLHLRGTTCGGHDSRLWHIPNCHRRMAGLGIPPERFSFASPATHTPPCNEIYPVQRMQRMQRMPGSTRLPKWQSPHHVARVAGVGLEALWGKLFLFILFHTHPPLKRNGPGEKNERNEKNERIRPGPSPGGRDSFHSIPPTPPGEKKRTR